MKKLLKILGVLLLILLLGIGAVLAYVSFALPGIDAPADLKVDLTPERIERGRYLANSVCLCMDCHGERDWTVFAAPPKPGTLGAGGERFDRTMQFPGEFYSRNLTPFALKEWSDGEIYRAITSGVSRDGHPFFPVMPYPNYNRLATEDVHSIIAYLRSLDPIETAPYPASQVDFPLNFILRTIPEPAQPMEKPAPTDPDYGAYMANAASCIECHTHTVKGERVGKPYAGGFVFNMPNGGVLRSANITPHETGIGSWSKEQFIERFKMYVDSGYTPPPVDMRAGEFQTVMPWSMYATMTEQDLGAIYDFLRTVEPVESVVVKWEITN